MLSIDIYDKLGKNGGMYKSCSCSLLSCKMNFHRGANIEGSWIWLLEFPFKRLYFGIHFKDLSCSVLRKTVLKAGMSPSLPDYMDILCCILPLSLEASQCQLSCVNLKSLVYETSYFMSYGATSQVPSVRGGGWLWWMSSWWMRDETTGPTRNCYPGPCEILKLSPSQGWCQPLPTFLAGMEWGRHMNFFSLLQTA